MSADFEFGSGPGLDKHLPEGERILWQGAPDARVFARRVFFIRGVAIYFALIAAWRLLEQGGAPVLDSGLVILLGAAIVALGLLSVLAWGYARTTAYTLTDARLVIRSGIALPVSFNLPLAHLTGADVKRYRDGSGTIAVQIDDTAHLAYPHLWPSVRPWRFRHPEPALRCLGDVDVVAEHLRTAFIAMHGEAEIVGEAVTRAGERSAKPAHAAKPPRAPAHVLNEVAASPER